MTTDPEQPAVSPPESDKSPRRHSEEITRAICGACGFGGFVVGIVVALLNEVTSTVDESDLRLKGMFTALTLLSMGVLIANPRIRGFVWLVIALYACYLLLTLLLVGR